MSVQEIVSTRRIQLVDGRLISLDELQLGDKILTLNPKTWKTESSKVEELDWIKPRVVHHFRTKAGHRAFIPNTWKVLTNKDTDIEEIAPTKDFHILLPRLYRFESQDKFSLELEQLPAISRVLGVEDIFRNFVDSAKISYKSIVSDLPIKYHHFMGLLNKRYGLPWYTCVKLSKMLDNNNILTNLYESSDGFKTPQGDFVLNLPTEISPDLAYLVGVVIGDGHISKTTCVIGVKGHNYRNMLNNLHKNIFACGATESDGRLSLPALTARYLEVLGIPFGDKSSSIKISDKFMKGLGFYDISLVKGLIDTDGTLRIRGTTPEITFYTKSYDLALQMITILLKSGISPSIIYTDKWCVSLSGFQAVKLARKLENLNNPSKNKRLSYIKSLKNIPHIKFYNLGHEINKCIRKINIGLSELSTKTGLSRNFLREVMQNKKAISSIYLEKLNDFLKDGKLGLILNSDVRWDKIKSIETIKNKMKLKFPLIKTDYEKPIFFLNHIPLTY